MMCLLLMLERLSFKQRMVLRDYEPIEEHNGAGIVQLIHLKWVAYRARLRRRQNNRTHLIEIWYLCDVAEVDDGKVLNLFGDRVKCLVHDHALRVPVVPEANDNDTILF